MCSPQKLKVKLNRQWRSKSESNLFHSGHAQAISLNNPQRTVVAYRTTRNVTLKRERCASFSRRSSNKLCRSVTTHPAEQVKPGLRPPSAQQTTPHVQDMATTEVVQGPPHNSGRKISNSKEWVNLSQKF
ncbi:hypothetical protein TNCT_422531 [Trichonephila clavata]|uniref:Uncharacterized protein n=1 Tax=Trichonephila clavata TaxID=2740835 RepID=A0A8X6KMI4_TRICU|nr:hypothetical protein TNCT_422531 [Trichonephila clavata]